MGAWLVSWLASAGFKLFGSSILKPILDAWANHENVDLEKFKAAAKNTGQLAGAILQANVEFSVTKARYAFRILQWWPFRALLLVLIGVSTFHYCAVVLDSTPFWIPFMGEAHIIGAWGVPTPPSPYDEYEREFLLFFILAKPVEAVVSQGLQTLTAYLVRR